LEADDISILEMNGYYQTLVASMHEWSQDASILLHGEAVFFPDFPPVEDAVWHSLIAPSSSDAITRDSSDYFSSLLTRLLSDHLSGGMYDHLTPQLQNETRSVPKTNTVSERDFAKLDRLLREKPNASTLALEAMVLFSNNKTAKWLQSKTKAEVAELMQKAREVAPEYKRLYTERKKKLQEDRIQLLKTKQKALQKSQENSLRQKEHLTQDIVQCGLWQSPDEIFHGLAKHKTKIAKVKALKAQINFRRKVLEQTHSDKDLFVFSKNRKPLSIEELISNLQKLLPESEESAGELETHEYQETLIGKGSDTGGAMKMEQNSGTMERF
jgi:E1A/CREB-binding protein